MSGRRASLAIALLALALAAPAMAQTRVGDLTTHEGEVPRRLVGYGLVVGLDGTGDRSFGRLSGATPSVRSVVNLLRRFQVEVPADQLRLRNVAAVLVTSEVSPWMRAGGRFEVQVSALGDATSLRGGTLWITPLVTDPDQSPLATAQGPIVVAGDESVRNLSLRRANSGRIPEGGVLEVDPPPSAMSRARLVLRQPDLVTASRIAAAINLQFGDTTARVEDPGSVRLVPRGPYAAQGAAFLAAVDTVTVAPHAPARIVIDRRDGTVVAGGEVVVGIATVSHRGITLQVGGLPAPSRGNGLVRVEAETYVQDVAAGLHAAGARADDLVAIFEALRAAGAITAQVVVR